MEAVYTPLSGVDPVTNDRVLKIIERVIEKVVRVEISDGRIYVGLLISVDQTKALFI